MTLPSFFRRDDFSSLDVIYLSGEGCHLCEEAFMEVERVRRAHPFPLRTIVIEPGDEWWERYWDKIPVLLIDGAQAFTARVDGDVLLQRLREAARRRTV